MAMLVSESVREIVPFQPTPNILGFSCCHLSGSLCQWHPMTRIHWRSWTSARRKSSCPPWKKWTYMSNSIQFRSITWLKHATKIPRNLDSERKMGGFDGEMSTSPRNHPTATPYSTAQAAMFSTTALAHCSMMAILFYPDLTGKWQWILAPHCAQTTNIVVAVLVLVVIVIIIIIIILIIQL